MAAIDSVYREGVLGGKDEVGETEMGDDDGE